MLFRSVKDPNHPLLHAYLLFVGEVYLPHQSPRSGWSKVLLDPVLERNGLRVPSPRVSGGMPDNSVLTLLLLLFIFQFSARTRCNLFYKLPSEHKALLDESGRNKAKLADAGMFHIFSAFPY